MDRRGSSGDFVDRRWYGPAVTEEPQPLRAVLGSRVRAVREAEGVRQQDLSDAARALGLTTWTRTRIAALERGDKAISAEDLIRLLAVLQIGVKRAVTIDELLDSDQRIALSDTASVAAREVPSLLSDGDAATRVRVAEAVGELSPEVRRARQESAAMVHRIRRAGGGKGLRTHGEINKIRAGLGEADERAARELELDGYPFVELCLVLWGRSLSAERDARLGDAPVGGAARRAALRGRITRELIVEARELLARAEEV